MISDVYEKFLKSSEEFIFAENKPEKSDIIFVPGNGYPQMAEEAAELAQAALKLARVLRAENPTPVTLEEAKMNLTAEFTDVQHCAGELKLETDWRQIDAKNRRFKQRMEEMVLFKERARIREEILEEVKEMGGCDASDEYAKGWDAAFAAICEESRRRKEELENDRIAEE